MTPEAKVKKAVVDILKAHNVYHFFPAANGYGRAGIPDIICCVNGYFLAIECKAGKGMPTALQARELDRIRSHKGDAMVMREDPGSARYLIETITTLQGLP
jgi:Holliday junction resolvase